MYQTRLGQSTVDDIKLSLIHIYVHKKMKTNEETSLQVLREVQPLLEAQEDFSNDALFEMLSAYAKEHGYKVGYVMWPIRTALSGKQMTPAGDVYKRQSLDRERRIASRQIPQHRQGMAGI